MEIEVEAFLPQDIHQPTSLSEEMMSSSWWNLEDIYTPAISSELQNLQNHFEADAPCLPALDSPWLSFQDFFSLDDDGPSIAEEQPVPHEHNTFLSNPEKYFVTPMENQYSIDNEEIPNDRTNISMLTSSDTDDIQPTIIEIERAVDDDDDDDDGDDGDDKQNDNETTDEDPKQESGGGGGATMMMNCKNLVSERNRRKRLSQQLLALRAIVPNITKMDKRSILVDALAYLRSIHEDTAKLEKELIREKQPPIPRRSPLISNMKESCQDNPVGILRVPRKLPSTSSSNYSATRIIKVDAERIEDQRFVVKITCKASEGACGDVLRLMESMGFDITYASVQETKPLEILSTIFIRVRKQGKMSEAKLKDCITSMALRSGLTLQNP